MTTSRPQDVLRAYFATEMNRDVDSIMEFYAPDARFTGPNEVREAHGEIRPFYEDSCARFPGLDVTVVTSFDSGENAVAEWSATLTGPAGGNLYLKGANVARIVGGKIVDMRSYYDAGRYDAKQES